MRGDRPRRVMMVVNDPAFFLSHRARIAREAQAAGIEMTLVTPPEPAAAVLRIREMGLRHIAVPMGRGQIAPRRDLGTLLALWRVFRAERPDVVHLVTIKPVVYGGIAARLAGVPTLSAISGLGYVFIRRGLKARALRAAVGMLYRAALNRRRGRVIFQNADDRETIRSLGVRLGDRVTMIRGSGVDLSRFRATPEPEGVPMVLMPARLLLDKGLAEFVDAARLVVSRGIAARFVCVGDPDPANPACVPPEMLAEWKAEGPVEFWGHRTDMPDVLAEAAIVVLPSYREGLPKALVEAAAAGRPVVTTDVPGCRDAVGPHTALLVEVRRVRPLADAIGALLADPDRRRAMGAAGRRLAEDAFCEIAVARRHLALYDALAEV